MHSGWDALVLVLGVVAAVGLAVTLVVGVLSTVPRRFPCPHCGALISHGSFVCLRCGRVLRWWQ